MKKTTKIILIAVLIVTLVSCVAACTEDTSIEVSANPQTVFVKGNDLDLSAGKLKVVKGGVSSEIAFNAEGVTVTGYNKDSAGEQTLTVSYQGATTTLKVNVVERITAAGHVSDYVVGDAFDTKGTLRITQDNGESFSVLLTDAKVQLSGFDSETAGKKTVNVVYTDGSTVFNGSFGVNVYASDNVKITVPTKRIYNSHDTKIDTAGGYLTVTANSGAVSKSIPIQDEWIKGFNPDVVTEAEPRKTQTITVEYPGQTLSFTVEIRLSDVTRIQRTANSLSSLDWSGAEPCEVSEEQGKAALRALEMYNELYEKDAELISKEDMLKILRPAAVYGKTVWTTSAEEYAALFSVSYNSLSVDCSDLDAVKTQFASLSALGKDAPLFTYGDILLNSVKDFGKETVYGENVLEKYLYDICDSETMQKVVKKIDLMLKMHESLSVVPAEWQVSDLQTEAVAAKVEQAAAYAVELSEITESIVERDLFNTVSEWRPEDKNDFFEIIYRYYFAMYQSDDEATQQKGMEGIDSLIDVCMPGLLEKYYLQYVGMLFEQYDLNYDMQEGEVITPAMSMDTISVVIAYRSLLDIRKAIFDSNDEMLITLFNAYNLNNIVNSAISSENGIYYICGSAMGVTEFEEIWTKYIEVIRDIANSDSSAGISDATKQKIEDLFKNFVALTPELQSSFLASVNAYGSMELFPDDGTERTPMFASLLLSYYMDVLPENLFFQGENGDENGLFLELLDALQYHLWRNENTGEETAEYGYMQLFLQSMKNAQTMYAGLTEADKALFDAHAGFLYTKYLRISGLYNEQGEYAPEISAEWQEKINNFETALQSLTNLYIRAMMWDFGAYPTYVSAYEFALSYYNDIMTNAPQEVKDAILYSKTNMFQDMSASHETFLYQFQMILYEFLLEYPIGGEYAMSAWEEYMESENLRGYMASMVNFYAAALVDSTQLTLETVKEAMKGFQALSDSEKSLFIAMDGYGEFAYYNTLGSFFLKQFNSSQTLANLTNDILNLEINWALGNSGEVNFSDEQYIAEWEKIAAAYEALSESDKTLFDDVLKETYDYYAGIYSQLKNPQTPPEEPTPDPVPPQTVE